MFVAIYRSRLNPGAAPGYEAGWRRITDLARERCGSLGSSLFVDAASGLHVAIACCPDRAARKACFANGPLDAAAEAAMKAAVAEALPDEELDAVSLAWAPGVIRELVQVSAPNATAPKPIVASRCARVGCICRSISTVCPSDCCSVEVGSSPFGERTDAG